MDNILNNRKIPTPSSNLSARIIAAATLRQNTPLWQIILEEVGAMFYIPKPAYAVAFCLVLGIVIGLQSEVEQASLITTDWFSFINDTDIDWGVSI